MLERREERRKRRAGCAAVRIGGVALAPPKVVFDLKVVSEEWRS